MHMLLLLLLSILDVTRKLAVLSPCVPPCKAAGICHMTVSHHRTWVTCLGTDAACSAEACIRVCRAAEQELLGSVCTSRADQAVLQQRDLHCGWCSS